MAGAATSPSSTRTRRAKPGVAPHTGATTSPPGADTEDVAVPDDELLIAADEQVDEVDLLAVESVEPIADVDGTVEVTVADVIVVGAIEPSAVEEDEEEDEENTAVTATIPGTVKEAAPAAESEEFTWDDEEESEALKQARKDAELTASADSVRAYLKQIGKVALLNAEEEVDLAKRIEAGLYSSERMRQSEEAGEKLPNQMRRDLRWIKRDGERAKNHLLEANLLLVVSLA